MPSLPRRLAPVVALLTPVAVLAAGCGSKAPTPAPSEQALGGTPGASASPVTDGDWPTYHHDAGRTGLAPGFPAPASPTVAWTAKLDGQVFGQPLVVGGMVYAATEQDTVYALDPASGAVVWQKHLGTPMAKANLPCGDIDPLGITSTMVYDPATGLLFALAESTGAHHTLYGLDAKTGAVRVTRAAEPPKGDPVAHQQRGALTLLGNTVYIPYGGLAGDCGDYIGSVVGVPTTGTGATTSYAVPTTREAGNWAPGGGTVQGGRLLYAVGNGEATKGQYDGSDSVLALTPQLTLADRFAPSTWADDNARDLDLGSMTPAVVGSYVFIAGKRGIGYTLRADHLGGVDGEVAQAQVCRAFGGASVSGDTVYVPCVDGPLAVRVDGDGSMHVLWHTRSAGKGSPVLGGGAVWVVDYDGGTLNVLDQATGAVRAKVAIGTAPHFASATLAGGKAYVGTNAGVVAVNA
jgi:polyvinyl alcohol dehydrogenase (cytochrome)